MAASAFRGGVDKPLQIEQQTRDLWVEFVRMERVEGGECVLGLHLGQPSQLLDRDRGVRVAGARSTSVAST